MSRWVAWLPLLVVLKLLIGDDPLGDRRSGPSGCSSPPSSALGLAAGGFLKFQEGDDSLRRGTGSGSAPLRSEPDPFLTEDGPGPGRGRLASGSATRGGQRRTVLA